MIASKNCAFLYLRLVNVHSRMKKSLYQEFSSYRIEHKQEIFILIQSCFFFWFHFIHKNKIKTDKIKQN